MNSDVPTGWEVVSIDGCAAIIAGQSPPGSTLNEDGRGTPFYQGAKDFGPIHPSRRVFTTQPTRQASSGDVLLSVRAPVGRVNRATEPCAIGRGVMAIRGDGIRAHTRFLEYFFRNFEGQWGVHESSGSVFTNLSKTALGGVEIQLPPIPEQAAIAELLGALDDKRSLNSEIRDTLHALGLTLLASRAVGLPSQTVGSVIEVLETGSRPRGGVSGVDAGVPSIGAESIRQAGIFDFSKTKFVSPEYFRNMRRGVLSEGDVLVYKDGGKPGELRPAVSYFGRGFPFARAAINEHVYRLRARNPWSGPILYFSLALPTSLEQMRERATGAAQPGLNQAAMKGIVIPKFPRSALLELNSFLTPILDRLVLCGAENRQLEGLLSALLPGLVSGRIRIPEAEAMVEEAV